MDIITSTYFNKFLSEQKIEGGKTESNFEKFINYIVLFPKNITNFSIPSVSIGNGDDGGIDGLAIAINNRFIANYAELENILDSGMEFTVEFYFIQSKISPSFECKEILNFGSGVVDIFKPENETKKRMNDALRSKYKMIRKIIDNYEYTKDRRCLLYYVTPGKYVEDDNLKSAKETIINNIKNLELFDECNIEINIYGSDYIRKQYELTKIQNSATFELKSKIEIPYMEKVDEAYFAIIPIKEYLNIVVDNDNKIRRGIFELNVRDFGGIEENRVNQDIEATILSDNKHAFGLLNNGITIVGNSLSKGQGKYTIKNFYIVNGCQTTNVLYKNRDKIDDDMWISVKFVITDDDEIIKSIVKATNNQTEVEEIQLLSMDEYQVKLESFYNSFTKYKRLYYERRDGQYRGNKEVSPIEIVTPDKQMRTFASIFLLEPHTASRYVGKLHKDISNRLFLQDHNPIMYYTSALLNYYVEDYLRNDKVDSEYSKFQYHILLIISQLVWKEEKRPQFNSKKMDDYCIKLIEKIVDKTEFSHLLNKAISIINNVVEDISNLANNGLASVVNDLLRYIDIGLNERELKNAKYFVSNVDTYLAPFSSMRIDGDMRFNFKDRVKDLICLFKKYNMEDYLDGVIDLTQILEEVNEEDRQNRKELSQLIFNSINEIVDSLFIKIERARKYER